MADAAADESREEQGVTPPMTDSIRLAHPRRASSQHPPFWLLWRACSRGRLRRLPRPGQDLHHDGDPGERLGHGRGRLRRPVLDSSAAPHRRRPAGSGDRGRTRGRALSLIAAPPHRRASTRRRSTTSSRVAHRGAHARDDRRGGDRDRAPPSEADVRGSRALEGQQRVDRDGEEDQRQVRDRRVEDPHGWPAPCRAPPGCRAGGTRRRTSRRTRSGGHRCRGPIEATGISSTEQAYRRPGVEDDPKAHLRAVAGGR